MPVTTTTTTTTTTVSAIKLISTLGLGLLSGYAIATPCIITPTMARLSTAKTARQLTQQHLVGSRITSFASAATAALLATSYFLSPLQARHPYLIYAGCLSAAASIASEVFGTAQVARLGQVSDGEVNGEQVTLEFDKLRRIGVCVASFVTLAFGVSVVGNYGDFY